MDPDFPPGILQYHAILRSVTYVARSFQGTHLFPFTFLLPGSLPSSYESKIGHVRYFIKVKNSRLPPSGWHPRINSTSRFVCLWNIKEIWIFFRQSLQADIVRDWRWNHKVNYIITKAAYSTKCHKYTKYSTNMPVKKTCQPKKYASKKIPKIGTQ